MTAKTTTEVAGKVAVVAAGAAVGALAAAACKGKEFTLKLNDESIKFGRCTSGSHSSGLTSCRGDYFR